MPISMSKKNVLLVLLILCNLACSTTSYNVHSIIKTPRSEQRVEVSQNVSIPISRDHQLACWITSLIYGGWCWVNLVHKYSHESLALDKANTSLTKKFGKNIRVEDQRIQFASWEWQIETLRSLNKVESDDHSNHQNVSTKPNRTDRPKIQNHQDKGIDYKSYLYRRLLKKKVENLKLKNWQIVGGIDVGTSHSDNGVGLSLGLDFPQHKVEVAYGITSKRNKLGQPVSISYISKLDSLDQKYLKIGLNHFAGEGRRKVYYSETLSINHEVRWNLSYLRSGLGFKNHESFGYSYYEFGLAINIYSHIRPNFNGAQTNLKDAKGIVIDESSSYFMQEGAGAYDFGAYLRFGVRL